MDSKDREATGLHCRTRQEQQPFDFMSEKRDKGCFSSTVKLNVGGHYFTTTIQTLTKDPNSMLAAMFSGMFEMQPSEDGAFFFDRDGTHFRFILNYLRTGKLTLPEGATFLKELEEEAEFYQIQGIIDALRPPKPPVLPGEPAEQFNETILLITVFEGYLKPYMKNEEYRQALIGWLPSELQDGEWRLLFRASRDGFAAKAFHSRCDNKGPTVVIVNSNQYIFGGFTEVSWTSKLRI